MDHYESRIRKTIIYVGDLLAQDRTDEFIAEMQRYAKLGVEMVIVMPDAERPAQWIKRVGAAVVPKLTELS